MFKLLAYIIVVSVVTAVCMILEGMLLVLCDIATRVKGVFV